MHSKKQKQKIGLIFTHLSNSHMRVTQTDIDTYTSVPIITCDEAQSMLDQIDSVVNYSVLMDNTQTHSFTIIVETNTYEPLNLLGTIFAIKWEPFLKHGDNINTKLK